jgi:DNA polymerase-3 subunit delta'
MLFSQIAGNTAAKTLLQRMVDTKRLPPVLLFHGPCDHKQRFAEELSHHLLGVSAPLQHHPDLHHYIPEKNGFHSITAMRELIEETSLPPFAARSKIFILHDAEKMLLACSNVLLKILEEPPPATWFILLATDANAILPTIFSRCRQIAFHAPPPLYAQGEDPRIELLLRVLRGGLLQGKTHGFEQLQRLEELLKEEIAHHEKEALLSLFLYWIRDLCLLQAGGDPLALYFQSEIQVLRAQALEMKPLPFSRLYTLVERAYARLASHVRLLSVIEECLLALPKLIEK